MSYSTQLLESLKQQLKSVPVASGIYSISFDNKRYIGQSDNLYRRIKSHITSLKSGHHCNDTLLDAFRRATQGSIEILEFCTISELKGKEHYWGTVHQPELNEKPIGYDLKGQYCTMPHPACDLWRHPCDKFALIFLRLQDRAEYIELMERCWIELFKEWRALSKLTWEQLESMNMLITGEPCFVEFNGHNKRCDFVRDLNTDWKDERFVTNDIIRQYRL